MQNPDFVSNHARYFLGLSLLYLVAYKYITEQWDWIEFMLFSMKLTQSNYQSMDKFVAFLAILKVQCGCTIRTVIKTQQCQW